jgi:hypothetical protein
MPTQTTQTATTSMTGRTTRNSRNAGATPGIAFATHIPPCPALKPSKKRNSDKTASDDQTDHLNGIPGDDDFGDDGSGDGDPEDPDDEPPDDDPPDNEGLYDQHNNPDNNDNDMQYNLADAIAALARNVQCQGDGPRLKVREPDPFNGTDSGKLRTFLIQLRLSFNDRPRTFTDDQNKINFAISYLKGIALTHFENSLIELDLTNPPAWSDNYKAFVSELKTYFGSTDLVSEAESKLENLSMKPTQCIAKYLVEFNRLMSITKWDNRALRHQFYRGLPARIKDEVSRVGKPNTLPEL